MSRNKTYRLKKKVSSLNDVITSLTDNHYVSNECADILEKSISGAPLDLMKRITSGRKPGSYPPELRSFAMTLKFYSAKAYRYVRKSFNLGLPHPSVIRGWYSEIDAEPGFTAPAFSALAAKVLAAKRDGNEILCSLTIDEMAIKKHVEWDGKQFRGFVDIGTGVDDDSLPAAKDALVFMVVCINGSWKVPVGYFLIDGLSGVEKANLVSNCLERLFHVGVKVISFTCDGPSSHIAMLRHLGAHLDDSALEPSFPHPSDPSVKVNVFLDVCHMLKLVRNTFADGRILIDGEGGTINWKHIVDLHALQENEGLRLANKLKSSHISWERQKMKVNLAAQCISSSVADALDFCCSHLKLAEFQDSQATSKFLRIFDRLFDILNSRNPFAKNFKAPVRKSNFGYIDNFLTQAFSYIMELKDKSGKRVLESRRKTGFLGFLIAIRSLQAMYHMHVSPSNSHLKYILSYKMSQDHLELFFAAVRSSGGSNNNPTSRQFTAAYKQLLMRHHIKGGHGNCIAQDNTDILIAVTDQCNINSFQTGISDLVIARRYDLELRAPADNVHDYADAPNVSELSEYKEAAISYIAGFVVKMVQKIINCPDCLQVLCVTKTDSQLPFVLFKDRGGLVHCSAGVNKICTETEKCILRMLHSNMGRLPQGRGLSSAITTAVLPVCVDADVFPSLNDHMFDSTCVDNHLFSLIKCCSACYTKIRMYHIGKRYTDVLQGDNIRKKLSRLILFKHQ